MHVWSETGSGSGYVTNWKVGSGSTKTAYWYVDLDLVQEARDAGQETQVPLGCRLWGGTAETHVSITELKKKKNINGHFIYVLHIRFALWMVEESDVINCTVTLNPFFHKCKDSFYSSKFLLKEHHLGQKKWGFSGPTPSSGPSNWFARINILTKSSLRIKKTPFKNPLWYLFFFLIISARFLANCGIG